MKYFLPALLIISMFSCGTYQVMTVASNDLQQNKDAEFVIENDSLELCYNFNGQNGPIKVRIKNKLQLPVYIDWQRSALIINERAVSYANKTVPISGAFGAWSGGGNHDVAYTSGRLRATASLPPDIEFIPPQTYITKELIGITNESIERLPDSAFTKKKLPAMGNSYEVIKLASFTPASSPLVFRSYLTLMVGDTLPRPLVCQHNFYVSELIRMTNQPEVLNGSRRGDRFYVVQDASADSVGYGIVGGKPVLLKSARPMH